MLGSLNFNKLIKHLTSVFIVAAAFAVATVVSSADSTYERVIAHGGGSVDGFETSSSVQAVELAIKNGFKWIELDMEFSSDNKIIMLHDWDRTMTTYLGREYENKLSLKQFNNQLICGRFEPLTFEKLTKILDRNPQIKIVTDTKAETDFVENFCKERGCEFALSEVWGKGGEGGIALAEKVLKTLETKESNFHVLYEDSLTLKEKIETVAKEIYGADGIELSPTASKQLKQLEELGFGELPVCMAKTQYSLSDDPALLGRPKNFKVHVREAYVSAGAGFVVVLTGAVMTMPGLPKQPAALSIDVSNEGVITGLF